ncbi:hypothetical protein Tco_1479134 [Tanacetum coccineum]
MSGTHLVAGDYRWGKNPLRSFPSDKSLGIPFPSDMSLGKGPTIRQGKGRLYLLRDVVVNLALQKSIALWEFSTKACSLIR